jgi:GNAT superfamily N-acetyltransferase
MEQICNADLSDPTHARAIVQLLNEYALDEMGGGVPLTDFVQTHLVSELAKRPGAHVVLAFVDDQPAGLLIAMEGFSTFSCMPLLNIHDVVVAHDHRGRGLSKRLLAQADEIARSIGCCKLTLEVLEGNVRAQAAYKACGYAGYELNPVMGKALFWQKKLDL